MSKKSGVNRHEVSKVEEQYAEISIGEQSAGAKDP